MSDPHEDSDPTRPGDRPPGRADRPGWTLLTNHGHVLLAVARSADVLVSDLAAQVGITTRATLTILKDLETAGYVRRRRVGRRTHYTVDAHQHFRHPTTASHEVGELLAIFAPSADEPVTDARGSTIDPGSS